MNTIEGLIMNIEFIKWLEQQTYRRYHPGDVLSSRKELNWHWVDEKYNDLGNWNWREIEEIYDRRNPHEYKF
jgi:hypothetical protein